jgi:cytochrome c-type biogenesis protein CcmF
MKEGETVQWADRQIRLVRSNEIELPDKLIAEAELEVTDRAGNVMLMRPAQHFHRLAETWTTEVDIRASWGGDFYTILHSGGTEGELYMTFVENPLMRFMWLGGAIMVAGTTVRLFPSRRRSKEAQQFPRRADDQGASAVVKGNRKVAA